MDYVRYLTGPLSVFAAGAAGSLVRAVVAPPANRRLMLAHIVIGALMALFVAPAVVEYWLRGNSIALQRGVALVIGIAGPIVAEIAIRVIQTRGDGVAEEIVDRVAGTEERK
ncbi:hypothetical protein [Burkholderia plantarii]|uniref:Uncharacterized protein n=1 Tax=Burkholderia plantarii TaxID=41899 RepID=A0A0B6RVZ4_BURPL|nr:hypothetical protein [Burkholderia plantarii]AJK46309.1 hypothetical protein BGL_1c18000 [Burkholderia plantarii]WLE59167.1 hypothetical protein GIY62_00165 [Burkholderia plantarii]GLZ19854.1 hypothetical protein Bpla01_33830 [Burkholderia plantarii]